MMGTSKNPAPASNLLATEPPRTTSCNSLYIRCARYPSWYAFLPERVFRCALMRMPIIGLLLLAACQSAEPNYYTLRAEPGEPLSGRKLIIKVQNPGIDETIDRPQMVRQGSDMRIRYDEMSQWAEPLDKMIERVVADDLQRRLPGSSVITESGNIVARPDYLVDLEVRQFGLNSKGQAVMEAVVSINRPASSGKPQTIFLAQPASGTGSAEAQALSALLAQSSGQIARDIINLH